MPQARARACFVAPSGFGYPLDALLSPSPCRFCFTPAALLGFALRSFLLSEGCRRVSTPGAPTCRFSRRCSRRRSSGPAQRAAASGFLPFRESLAHDPGLVSRKPDAPLGFNLLGFSGRGLTAGFRLRLLPHASRFADLATRGRRRLGVSIDLGLAFPAYQGEPNGQNKQPFQAFCTSTDLGVRERLASGL